jgi:heme A synthase
MNLVYYAHSGLRYLVLLAALAALVALVRGRSGGRAYAGAARTATGMYVGTMHLQVLLGILLVVLGRWHAAVMGHLIMNLLAVAVATMLSAWARREKDARKAYTFALTGVAVSLLLLFAGIAAIGRHPLQSRALDQIEAEIR